MAALCSVPDCERDATERWLCEIHLAHIEAHDALTETDEALKLMERFTDLADEFGNDLLTTTMVKGRDELKVKRREYQERVRVAGEAL